MADSASRRVIEAEPTVDRPALHPVARPGRPEQRRGRRAARAHPSADRASAPGLRRLAFVFRPRSFSPLVLPAAAAGLCELLWVFDGDDPEAVAMLPLLNRLGGAVDVARLSVDDAAAAIAQSNPDGILALADNRLGWTAQVAARLGLPFMSPAAAERATDKYLQRVALRDAGLPGPAFDRVPPLADRDAWAQLAACVRFPAVLKPRRSEASQNTVLVDSPQQARAALAEMFGSAPRGMPEMVLEQYLPAQPGAAGDGFASYLSVESVASAGSISHIAVTGRTPLATPFRETGAFVPAAISSAEQVVVLAVATAAAEAIDIGVGCLHTEIQLTPEGPRVIEVNGRIGGIPGVVAAATGVDPRVVAMRVALGERVVFEGLPAASGVGYHLGRYADIASGRLLAVEGLEAWRDDPHVDEVVLNRAPGQRIDWREGTDGCVLTIDGHVDDHDQLRRLAARLQSEVTITAE